MIFYLHFSGELVQLEELIEEVVNTKEKQKSEEQREFEKEDRRKKGGREMCQQSSSICHKETEKKNLPLKEEMNLSIF